MEVIKIDKLDPTLMESTLTEEECDKLLQEITDIVNAPEGTTVNQSLREASPDLIIAGVTGGLMLIAMIRKYIKNKYSLAAKKILDQSKELNDLYTKIEDLLKHDKMARFKHRNDKISTTLKYIVLQDRTNGKMYNIVIDYLVFNADAIINSLNQMMDYLNQAKPQDEDALIANWADSLVKDIDELFTRDHWYIERCVPLLKSEVYNSVPLEKALMSFKATFGNIYNWIYAINKTTAEQMTYLQFVEKAYKSAMATHGNTKARREAIDRVFKHTLEKATQSITFNTGVMDVLTEEIKYYAEELNRIYQMIKQ